jgi:four helix bundle protein
MTNVEFNEMFRDRTRDFAVEVLKFLAGVPFNTGTKILSYQLGKSATSVGANFRAFCRGRSKKEKYAKICIVVEEADECVYWIDLFSEMSYGDKRELKAMSAEALEILKVTAKIKSSLSRSHPLTSLTSQISRELTSPHPLTGAHHSHRLTSSHLSDL